MNITASLQIKNNIYLASFYGLRRSEVLGLRWDAFNFEDKTITIKHKAIETRKDNKRVILLKDKTKNQSSYRTLPLVDDIIVLPQIFNYWLGYCDSNTGMSESESDALPLGDTPIYVRGDFLPYLLYIISYFFNDFLPENTATSPSSASIFNNLLYLATRSVLQGAPVLICPAFVATATSASVVSSVSTTPLGICNNV